jgi:hypothetical protein
MTLILCSLTLELAGTYPPMRHSLTMAEVILSVLPTLLAMQSVTGALILTVSLPLVHPLVP